MFFANRKAWDGRGDFQPTSVQSSVLGSTTCIEFLPSAWPSEGPGMLHLILTSTHFTFVIKSKIIVIFLNDKTFKKN